MSVFLALAMQAAVPTKERGQFFSAAERQRKMAEYADCVVKDRPGKSALIVLRQQWKENVADRDLEKVIASSCVPDLGTMIIMSRSILQFALADALIRAKQISVPADLSLVGPLDHGDGEARFRALIAKGKKASTAEKRAAMEAAAVTELSRFGECVVRGAPEQATVLLRTKVAGPAEMEALRGLSPTFTSCLNKGQQVTFSRETLRGVVAYNYYRLASAARSGTPQVAKQ
ncbi:hypothetical protein [Sphingomonas sp.]|uniref:hypothetical protein n=1 Tax=Sphingomonas sp. TaxID=28214 RepID=UPI00286C7452|nr:hypothetical protein [Sphingomonas sp.]